MNHCISLVKIHWTYHVGISTLHNPHFLSHSHFFLEYDRYVAAQLTKLNKQICKCIIAKTVADFLDYKTKMNYVNKVIKMVKIPHSSTVDFHGNRRQSTERVKKYATLVLSITLVNDWLIFLNSFSVGLGNKFAARPVLYFPPQHVTTLPCKTSAADMFNFQQVSDGVHGHVQIWENKPDIWWSCGKKLLVYTTVMCCWLSSYYLLRERSLESYLSSVTL